MEQQPRDTSYQILNKVPAVTLTFWVIKIMTTTVGETIADYLIVDVGLGAVVTGLVMSVLFVIALYAQINTKRCIPWIYWLSVVLVSILGTQITDVMTDKLEVSLYLSTAVFSAVLIAIFIAWYKHEKTLSITSINTRRREFFYWAAILCTFALGTAAGDLATEAIGLGFQMGVIIFSGLIIFATLAYYAGANSIMTFWFAYVLTRPLGASIGDLLSQAKEYGGVGFGAMYTSAIFLSVIVVLVAMAQRTSAATKSATSLP
ncbi:MAG TPA: hypothetical protein VL550_02160 [Rhodocyclaceae bacterium]|nr:hypothetical protein [Rhodocyclaceae bacterium]